MAVSAIQTARMLRRPGLLELVSALSLTIAAPAMAAADGLPRLDPTNGSAGTIYTFLMQGATRSMDPGLASATLSFRGAMTLFQGAGTGEFDADMDLDQNGDGLTDRVLSCSGFVGRGRFGLRCKEDDGLTDIRFEVTGRALVLDSGKLALRKAGGRGHTETHTLLFGFQATEQ